MRAACVGASAAAAAVARAALTAAAAAAENGGAHLPVEPVATARPSPSVLAFPVGDGMPEGRWASACSLNCILPGVTETRKILDEPFKIGADVCVAHVDDAAATMGPGNATQLAKDAIQGALSTLDTARLQSASRWPLPVIKYEPHAAQEGAQPHCPMGSRLVDGRPWWPAHPNLLSVAKDDVADEHRQLVADEAMVFGALAMGRNVLGGNVQRQVGVYDLLAVSVQRLGVCIDEWCTSVVAVDTTRPSVPITSCNSASTMDGGNGTRSSNGTPSDDCSTTNVPIITHVGPDGVERPVHMASSELLALGRGMMGSPSWFRRASATFHLGGQLTLRGPTLLVPQASNKGLLSIQNGEETTQWDLNGTVLGGPFSSDSGSLPATPTSTPFLAHLATLLCAGSLHSFLISPSACDGIRPWGRVRRASGLVEVEGNIMDAGVWAGSGKLEWKITPSMVTPVTADDAPESGPSLPYLRPAWKSGELPFDTVTVLGTENASNVQVVPHELVGRSSREVNPLSVEEADLAASLFQRQLVVPTSIVAAARSSSSVSTDLDMDAASTVNNLVRTPGATIELTRELDRLSHAYDRRVFQEEHPAPPVSTADLVLAIIVVVPELGALLVLLLTTERWGRAALLGFSTIVVLGAVSISGVLALASQEAAGAAWRARSTRTATHAAFASGDAVNEWGNPTLAGTLVVVDKSFLLLGPTMYRPVQIWRVAAVVCGAYIVSAAAMAARVLFLAWQQRRVWRIDVEAPSPGAQREAPRGTRR